MDDDEDGDISCGGKRTSHHFFSPLAIEFEIDEFEVWGYCAVDPLKVEVLKPAARALVVAEHTRLVEATGQLL